MNVMIITNPLLMLILLFEESNVNAKVVGNALCSVNFIAHVCTAGLQKLVSYYTGAIV